jgi:pimeloyl-ACP methyl ester carboxylesterase
MIPETAVETNRRYADFDAELIEGVGHYLLLEKPEAFNPALRRALAEIAAAPHE